MPPTARDRMTSFVLAYLRGWERGSTAREVAKSLGISLKTLYHNRKLCRSNGVMLPDLDRPPPSNRTDWTKLANIVEERVAGTVDPAAETYAEEESAGEHGPADEVDSEVSRLMAKVAAASAAAEEARLRTVEDFVGEEEDAAPDLPSE